MTAVLQAADIAPDSLLTLSDLPEDLSAEKTRWLLVDHNALTGQLKTKFSGAITGCIDHHEDEDAVPRDAQPRVVEPCGSCMSLVIEESRTLWDEAAKAQTTDEAEKLAILSLAPILIDTINLTEKHKVKPKDISATQFLETKLQNLRAYDRKAYYGHISTVKEDISQLGFRDILRKDYKEWTEGQGLRLGTSSVVKGLDYLTEKKDSTEVFFEALSSWGQEKDLDLVSVMTTSHNEKDEFQRHLLVWGRTDKGLEALQAFESASSNKLQLTIFNDGHFDNKDRKAWQQGNLAASRKQIAPLLRQALAGVS